MKNYESLVKKFNFTTIEDKYGAMFTLEEIKEALGLDIKMQEETQVFEIFDKIITVDIEKRKISTWIYVDLYDKDDYEYEEEENFVDLDDEEEDWDDEEGDFVEGIVLPKVGSVHIVEWWRKKIKIFFQKKEYFYKYRILYNINNLIHSLITSK